MESSRNPKSVEVSEVVKVHRPIPNVNFWINLGSYACQYVYSSRAQGTRTDFANPGRSGTNPMKNATAARQFVPNLLYIYMPLGRYISGTDSTCLSTTHCHDQEVSNYSLIRVCLGRTSESKVLLRQLVEENGHCPHTYVVGDQDARNRSEPDRVAGHEINQCLGGDQDVPWCHSPSTKDGTYELASANVNIPWQQGGQISCYRDGIGGDIDTDRCNQECKRTEESGSSASLDASQRSPTMARRRTYLRGPAINNKEGIPEKLPIQYLSAIGPNNTK